MEDRWHPGNAVMLPYGQLRSQKSRIKFCHLSSKRVFHHSYPPGSLYKWDLMPTYDWIIVELCLRTTMKMYKKHFFTPQTYTIYRCMLLVCVMQHCGAVSSNSYLIALESQSWSWAWVTDCKHHMLSMLVFSGFLLPPRNIPVGRLATVKILDMKGNSTASIHRWIQYKAKFIGLFCSLSTFLSLWNVSLMHLN